MLVLLNYQRTASRRSFSSSVPTLDLDIEPPLPNDEDDDFEWMEFRAFPNFRSKPPVMLPDGSELHANGSVLLPNRSVLMTTYSDIPPNILEYVQLTLSIFELNYSNIYVDLVATYTDFVVQDMYTEY